MYKYISYILISLLPASIVFATDFVNPGNASAPLSLSTNDTFTNNSGLFQSVATETDSLGTVSVGSDSSGNTITINGGSVSATGTSSGGVATLPLYGASSSSTAIGLSTGASITKNTTQSSLEAMNFSGPIAFTMSGGTVDGSITAGTSSSITQTGGSISDAVTLGANSTVSVNNATITGLLTVGNESSVSLAGTATLTAGIAGTATTLNFATGGFTPPTGTGIKTLNVNSGSHTLSGGSAYTLSEALTVVSGATLTIDSVLSAGLAVTTNAGTINCSVVSGLPEGDINNSGLLSFTAAQTFNNDTTSSGTINLNSNTLTNSGVFTNSGAISTGTVTNDGIFTYDGGTLTNITFNNNLTLNLSQSFTATTFTNASGGSIFIYDSGVLNHAVTAGTQIYYGQDSSGVTRAGTFQTQGNISNVPNISVFAGSTLAVPNLISALSGAFTVMENANVTFAGGIVAGSTGSFSNAGITTISSANSINVTGAFTNSGIFEIASGGSLLTANYSSITNTGIIYLPSGGTMTVGADVDMGGTLSIGRNIAGATSVGSLTTANALTMQSINMYSTSTLTASGGANNPVTADLYLLGTTADPFSGTVQGSRLTIGMDSFGDTFNPTVTINAAISGFSSLYVNDGILTTLGAGNITNLDAGLFVASGATFNAGANVTGGSINGSNGGTTSIFANFSITNFTNSIGGVFNIGNGCTIAAATTLNNFSTGDGSSPGINITGTTTHNGVINNSGTLRYQGTLNGTGTINNLSGGNIEFNVVTANAATINNQSGATLEVFFDSTNTGTIDNYGTMTVYSAALNGGGGIINNQSGGTLNLSPVFNNTQTITNLAGGTLNMTETGTHDSATLNNFGTMNYTGTYTGTTTIQNNSGGVLTLNGASNGLPIANQAGGTVVVTGECTNTNTITSLTGTLTINGTILNTGGSILTGTGATTTITDSNVENLISNGQNSVMTITGTNTFGGYVANNLGTLNVEGDYTMTGADALVNDGIGSVLNVTGTTNITSTAANSYLNNSTHNTSINSSTDFGQIIANNAIGLTSATVNISTDITNTNGEKQSYIILQGSSITGPDAFSFPSTDLYRVITVEQTATTVTVNINAEEVTLPINQDIAVVLENMFDNTANSGQQALEDAFLSVDRKLNDSLHQMIPISNALAYDNKMQEIVFNKVDTRLAGLRDGWDTGGVHKGIAAGDIMPGNSFWISGSGSLTQQGSSGEDDGYNAKTGVVLLGRDFQRKNNIIGVAGGYSYTHLKELSNDNFTNNTSRWHAMVYGSHEFRCCNYWDWLFTTNFNSNHAKRDITIAGSSFNTRADYDSYQLSARVVRGRSFSFLDSYRFTPYTLLQYSFIHQDSYAEQGSVAALNVEDLDRSIATIGLGARFNFPVDAWDCIGMRELRATVIYDFINNNNNTNANFVVGSDSFAVTSSPVRLGLQLGAGISILMADRLVFELNYDFEVRSRFTDHTGLLKIKYVF